MAFPFRDNRRHGTDGQTDGVRHLMRPGPHKTLFMSYSCSKGS